MAQMQALLKIKADVQGGGAVQSLASNIGGLKASADKATSGFKGMATAAAGLATTIGAAALVGGIKGVMNAFSEFQRDTNLLENGLKNLGGTAPQQFDILMKSADKLGKMTLFNESDFTQGFGLLTSFTNISVKQFDRLGAAAADLAQTSGTDVKSAFMQLGKALNDPVKGLTALNRAGVQFTDEQKAMIESMVDVGNVAGAQEMILKELERQYGGNAAAAAQGYAGALDSLGESFYDLQKALGPFIDQALTPLINSLTNLVNFITERVVPILDSLPGPLKTVVGFVGALAVGIAAIAGPLLLVLPGLVTLGTAIAGLKIGATIAGWAALAGPAITAISAAFTGLLTFLTGTLLPGLVAFFSGPVGWTVLAVAAVVAMVILFREPIMQFFTWLGGAISTAFSGLMGLLQPIFVQPFIDLWNNVLRKPVTAMFDWIGGYIKASMKTALTLAELVFVKPWVNLWNVVLRKPVTTMIGWLQTAWKGITKFFADNVTTPISKAWTALNQLLPDAMKKTAEFVNSVWTGIINNVKNVFRSMLNFIVSGINKAISAINYLIDGYNRIPVVADIPRLGFLSVPAFAEGGVVDRPTLAMVGEGGEREFIIPQSKMAAASANFLSGARGGAVIPQSSGGGGGGGNAQISITTGPVLQQGGEQYVTLYDLERAMQMTADGVYKSLRTSSGRYAVGTR